MAPRSFKSQLRIIKHKLDSLALTHNDKMVQRERRVKMIYYEQGQSNLISSHSLVES